MNNRSFTANKKWWCGGGLALALLFITVQSMQSTIAGYGKLLPAQMAVLQNKDGLVSFYTINYVTGKQEDLCVIQIERGEMLQLHMSPALNDQHMMTRDDTVAVIRSSATEEQIVLLRGELQVAQATLAAERTGEKSEVIDSYRHRLELARSQMQAKERSHQRIAELYKKDLTTADLYDISASELEALKLEAKTAQCDLNAITSGVKPSMQHMLQCKVAALEDQLAVLHEHKKRLSLLAPFTGRLSTFIASDTLLTISDSSRYVVLLPVRLADMEAVQPGAVVHCRFGSRQQTAAGAICKIKRDIFYLNSQPMVTAVAVLQQPYGDWPDGMVCKYEISCHSRLTRLISAGL